MRRKKIVKEKTKTALHVHVHAKSQELLTHSFVELLTHSFVEQKHAIGRTN